MNKILKNKIELAIVLFDGSFDSVGIFTEEEAKEFIEKNKDCQFARREINGN